MPADVSGVNVTITLFANSIAAGRKNFPDSFWDRLVRAIGLVGSRAKVLDLGTTIGEAARGFARLGADVTAIDPTNRFFPEALDLDRSAGVMVKYAVGTPAQTGQPDQAFDVVFAAESWPSIHAESAAAEAARVLKPRGTLAIAAFGWQPLPRNVVEATEELIERFVADWPRGIINRLYGGWWPPVHAAGFRDFRTFFHDNDYAYSHAEFQSYVAARLGDRLGAAARVRFDTELDSILKKRFAGDYVVAPHRSFCFMAERP